jgi:hypothetical protein
MTMWFAERKSNPEELPADWLALASLIFGVMGLMMRVRYSTSALSAISC